MSLATNKEFASRCFSALLSCLVCLSFLAFLACFLKLWTEKSNKTHFDNRGISRESLVDHPQVEAINESLTHATLSKEYDSNHSGSDDDDESTIVGGSVGIRSTPPHSPSQSDDTVTASDASHYWSAGNSFTTGNTTERSSVYSWGDDEFDLQTSRMVRGMFQAIERMLFEGVLSGSTSLQQECREWMRAFPHLRVLGKQMFALRDDGYESIKSNSYQSSFESSSLVFEDVLEIRGSMLHPIDISSQLEITADTSSLSSSKFEFSHLYEEIFAADGTVEEYLAYDIREMDDDENPKKYHVPRRRRLGFPPITPNACVRDTVLQHVFDSLWSAVTSRLSHPIRNKSFLKLLVENQAWSRDNASLPADGIRSSVKDGGSDSDHHAELDRRIYPVGYDMNDPPNVYSPMSFADRQKISSLNPPSFVTSPFNLRSFYPDSIALPPSRGYLEQGPGGRYTSMGRNSTAPYFLNSADISSLNDVMKISQKKLQTRADRVTNEDLSTDVFPEAGIRFPGAMLNGPHQQAISAHSSLSVMGSFGITSPVSGIPRHLPAKEAVLRQQSGHGRKGRVRPKLVPLDRAKTPTVDHNRLNVKATKLVPGPVDSAASYGGARINSPSNSFKPPTAPNPSTGAGTYWVNTINSKLPPIASNLESLPENSLSEFKKSRGRTAHTRISSAVGEDKFSNKMMDGLSRPNTTHTFRTDNFPTKRVSSSTPNPIPTPLAKSNSPAGTSYLAPSGGAFLFPYHSTSSPDHSAGLVRITGKSINLNNFIQPSSPDGGLGPLQSSWGPPYQATPHAKKKRPAMQ